MIFQFAAYGVLWIILPVVAFGAARWRGWPGAVVAHAMIAALIVALDLHWVVNNGLQSPETRLGTAIAIALRASVINAMLIPISVVALMLRRNGPRAVA